MIQPRDLRDLRGKIPLNPVPREAFDEPRRTFVNKFLEDGGDDRIRRFDLIAMAERAEAEDALKSTEYVFEPELRPAWVFKGVDGAMLDEDGDPDFEKMLDALHSADPEGCHKEADAILVAHLRSIGHNGIADAYERARKRVGFWYV